ncbi:hypothetical protein EDC96DRAFT_544261 [Choanephora cucurbitarum]|nr:hypothetical protein EDC96DRAFT_544261 [Choanephora cucurbitarum]
MSHMEDDEQTHLYNRRVTTSCILVNLRTGLLFIVTRKPLLNGFRFEMTMLHTTTFMFVYPTYVLLQHNSITSFVLIPRNNGINIAWFWCRTNLRCSYVRYTLFTLYHWFLLDQSRVREDEIFATMNNSASILNSVIAG